MWSNCMDPNMPRLALFAQRDIHSGEELTFDYASSKTGFKIYNIKEKIMI